MNRIEQEYACAWCGTRASLDAEPVTEKRDDREQHVTHKCESCGQFTKMKYNLEYYESEAVAHVKRQGGGLCRLCNHYGDDCTGEEVSITADIPELTDAQQTEMVNNMNKALADAEARLVNACPDCRKDNACPEHSDWKYKLPAIAMLLCKEPLMTTVNVNEAMACIEVEALAIDFQCVRELDGTLGIHAYFEDGSTAEVEMQIPRFVDDQSVQEIADSIVASITKYVSPTDEDEREQGLAPDVQLCQKPIVISYRDGCVACVYGDTNQQVIFVDHDAVRKPMVRSHYMVPTSELSGTTKEAIDAREEF